MAKMNKVIDVHLEISKKSMSATSNAVRLFNPQNRQLQCHPSQLVAMKERRSAIVRPHRYGSSNTAIAKQLQISRVQVWRTVRRFRERGSNLEKGPRSKRTPSAAIKSVRGKIRRNPWPLNSVAAETGLSDRDVLR